MTKNEFLKMKSKITERFQKDIADLERLWKTYSEDDVSPLSDDRTVRSVSYSVVSRGKKGSLKGQVLSAIRSFNGREFTVGEVVKACPPDLRYNSIATAVIRLADVYHKLRVTYKGKGSSDPTRYVQK